MSRLEKTACYPGSLGDSQETEGSKGGTGEEDLKVLALNSLSRGAEVIQEEGNPEARNGENIQKPVDRGSMPKESLGHTAEEKLNPEKGGVRRKPNKSKA